MIEALKAHSTSGKRVLEQLTVVDAFADSLKAMDSYKQLHEQFPKREFYVVYTDRKQLDISERRWLGIRGA
ncbi:MAG: hypothetical protein L0229_24860 [Blastocatellia bacterium]|nr:hypothetical protein [Blastocatellia bacterium]